MKISKLQSSNFCLFKLVLLLIMMHGISSSWAQELVNQGLLANAQLDLLSDSNVQRNSNEAKDNLVMLLPQIDYSNTIGKHQFSAAYIGRYTRYAELSQFDYENHMATIGILFDHTASLSTEFTADYENAIEEPGSTNGVLVNATEFNQFSRSQAAATILYGTRESKGQIIVTLDYSKVDFSNNDQKFRNVDTTSILGSYFNRIAPNTRLFVEVETADFDYTDTTSMNDQSSQQNIYSTGIEWVSSAQTTSVFRLGYQTRDFENPTFADDNGLSYSLDFIWQPKSYTLVTFGAARADTESAIQGTAGIVRKSYSVDLQHELTNLLILDSAIEYSEDDLSIRTDTNTVFQLGFTYSARHWLDIRLSYALENRDSNNSLFNYDSEVIRLSLISTFD